MQIELSQLHCLTSWSYVAAGGVWDRHSSQATQQPSQPLSPIANPSNLLARIDAASEPQTSYSRDTDADSKTESSRERVPVSRRFPHLWQSTAQQHKEAGVYPDPSPLEMRTRSKTAALPRKAAFSPALGAADEDWGLEHQAREMAPRDTAWGEGAVQHTQYGWVLKPDGNAGQAEHNSGGDGGDGWYVAHDGRSRWRNVGGSTEGFEPSQSLSIAGHPPRKQGQLRHVQRQGQPHTYSCEEERSRPNVQLYSKRAEVGCETPVGRPGVQGDGRTGSTPWAAAAMALQLAGESVNTPVSTLGDDLNEVAALLNRLTPMKQGVYS